MASVDEMSEPENDIQTEEQLQSTRIPDDQLLANLKEAETKLNDSDSNPSVLSSICVEIRKTILQALPHSKPSVMIRACDLYAKLLSRVSISYEHLTFSSCVHHLVGFLKNARGKKCSRKCNVKTTICYASEHIPVNNFVRFWTNVSSLYIDGKLEGDAEAMESILIQAYGSLIRYANGSNLHQLGMNACAKLLDHHQITTTKINSAYKVAFELTKMDLNKTNRNVLVQLVTLIADRETNLFRRDDGDDEDMENPDGTPKPPQQTLSTPQKNRKANQYPVLSFLQLCCSNAPDRADPRSTLALVMHEILQSRSSDHISRFIPIFDRLSRHLKVSVRMLALELSGMVANSIVKENDEEGFPNVQCLIKIFADRCQDKAAAVRAKVISILSEVLKLAITNSRHDVRDQAEARFRVVFSRLRDEKSKVRKAAVEYVGTVLCDHIQRDKKTLSLLSNGQGRSNVESHDFCIPKRIFESHFVLRSSDAVANVRQSAICQMTAITVEAAKHEDHSLLEELFGYWSESVLPRIDDGDTRCQEEVCRAIDLILFESASRNNASKSSRGKKKTGNDSNRIHSLENMFLANFVSCRTRVAELSRNAITQICKEKTKARRLLQLLIDKVETSTSDEKGTQAARNVTAGAWVAISKLAEEGSGTLVRDALGEEHIINEVINKRNVHAAVIAASFIEKLGKTDSEKLVKALEDIMFSLNDLPVEDEYEDVSLIIAKLLCSIDNRIGKELLRRWEELIPINVTDMTEEAKIQLLRNIGNICVTFHFEEPPSDKILTLVQAMSSTLENSTKIRALAIATLGKVCLCEGLTDAQVAQAVKTRKNVAGIKRARNMGEALTRRFVSIFIRELDDASSQVTRNNAVLVLCDLCRRYTAIVEPFMGRVASLLADPSEFIRVQVLSSMINLLQEDYIKMRPGPVFYQIALSILDDCANIQKTAEYALLHVVSPKNPSLFAVSFVELIFVLNECKDCEKYYQFSMPKYALVSAKDSRGLSYEQRSMVYEIFLRGMSVEQRLKLPGRFNTEILSLVLDEKLQLSSKMVENVIHDTLSLLPSPHLTPFSKRKDKGDKLASMGDDDTEEATPHATRGIALLKKMQVTELRENTIPVLVEVKQFLENYRSPLLKTLMNTLCSLVEPHEDELGDLIRNNMLREEVKHELATKAKEPKGTKRRANPETSTLENVQKQDKLNDENANSVKKPLTPTSERRALSENVNFPVPRTRDRKRKVVTCNSDESSDEEFLPSGHKERANGKCFSARIQASPKLMAIASAQRNRQFSAKKGDLEGVKSGFATAMAQIEGEAAGM